MSDYAKEVQSKEPQGPDTLVEEGLDGGTLKVWPSSELSTRPSLHIGVWWDGNDGEWTPEFLTVGLDKTAVIDLRDTLNDWLGH